MKAIPSLVVVDTAEITGIIEQAVEKAVWKAMARMPKSDTFRPAQVTQGQAAEILGLHRTTVTKLLKNKSLNLNACGMIPMKELELAMGA